MPSKRRTRRLARSKEPPPTKVPLSAPKLESLEDLRARASSAVSLSRDFKVDVLVRAWSADKKLFDGLLALPGFVELPEAAKLLEVLDSGRRAARLAHRLP